MQFFNMRDDETKNWHNYLIMQVPKEEFNTLKTKFDTQVPKLDCWPMIRNGTPCIVFEYGGVICLSETFGSGQTLGEKLNVDDIITVILTDKQQNHLFLKKDNRLSLNFNLEEVIVYTFTYTKEMEQTYEIFTHFKNLKQGNSEVAVKNNSCLSFR